MTMILADLTRNEKTHTVEFLHGNNGLAFVRTLDGENIFSQQSMGGPYMDSQGFVHLDQLTNVREEFINNPPDDEAAEDAELARQREWLGEEDDHRSNLYPH